MRKKKQKAYIPWLWLSPSIFLVVLFVVIPLVKVVISSFFIVNSNGSLNKWVGFDNYVSLFSDTLFMTAVKNTFLFTLYTVPISIVIGFVNSYSTQKYSHFSTIVSSFLIIPCIISMPVAALIFQAIMMPKLGILSKLFTTEINWLYSKETSLISLSIIQIWNSSAFAYIFYLNGMRNIPSEYTDQASIDGANHLQLIRYIYIPATKPTTEYLLFSNIITSMMMMSLTNTLTNGGPQNSTYTVIQYLYTKFTSTGNMTITNAATVIILIMFLTLFLIFVLLNGEKPYAENTN